MSEQTVFPISAFTPPPDGWLCIDGEKQFLKDFRTAERYRELRNCGFTEMIFSGETKYEGEPFEGSSLKKMLDLAQECKLRAIVFDERILRLTADAKERIVGEIFKTQRELNAFVAKCLSDYSFHPAFYGVSVTDEPMIGKREVIREICKAVHAACPQAFVHTCFLPFIQDRGRLEGAFGKGYADGWAAYRNYIRKMSASGIGYFGYDAYPFGMWEGKNDMCAGYLRNMQEVAQTAQKCGVPFHMTIQSFSSGAADELRRVDESDLNWQSNLALAFGCTKIYCFTYWRFTTRTRDHFTSAIMDDDGSKLLYDEAQRNNALICRTYPHIAGARYEASRIVAAPHANKAMQGLKQSPIPQIYACRSQAPVLINRLDKQGKKVFCVLNLRDCYEKFVNVLRFRVQNQEKEILILKRGEKMRLEADQGIFTLALEPGEAVWILQEKENLA